MFWVFCFLHSEEKGGGTSRIVHLLLLITRCMGRAAGEMEHSWPIRTFYSISRSDKDDDLRMTGVHRHTYAHAQQGGDTQLFLFLRGQELEVTPKQKANPSYTQKSTHRWLSTSSAHESLCMASKREEDVG